MPAKKPTNKSAFIRSQPASLSAAEIVAKAKTEGITIRPGLVYEVRRVAMTKRTAKVKKAPMVTKTGTPSNAAATTSKAAFVRARTHLSPKEIVEDAQAAGIKLNVGYVYNVRGAAKATSKKTVTKQAARRTTKRTAPSVTLPITTPSKAEDLLRAVAAEIGLARAIEVLMAQRAQVHAVLRG